MPTLFQDPPVQTTPTVDVSLKPSTSFSLAKVESSSPEIPTIEFTPAEQKEITQIGGTILSNNLDSVYSFGEGPAKRVAALSDRTLGLVRANQTGEFGSELTKIVRLANGISFSGAQQNKTPLVGWLIDKVKRTSIDIRASYDTVAGQMTSAIASMDRTQTTLEQSVQSMEDMYGANIQEYRDYCKYVVAGKMRLEQMQAELLHAKQSLSSNPDPMASQQVNDLAKVVDTLEKRLHDLEIAKVLCVQTAVEIRMIQGNNRNLVGQYKDIKALTIPAWKKQFTLYLAVQDQARAAKTSKEVKDFTNKLLSENAKILGENSVAIAEQNQRGLVDIETVQKVNSSLIEALQKAQQIEDDGKARRKQNGEQLTQLTSDLRTRLQAIGNSQGPSSFIR
jgi:uncharacterized protein YaaN involved in tellurite resistance